jgi:glycosyl hydrolase family 42 (putative beta-galactosidase)
MLGISYRPLQVDAFGLDRRATLEELLAYPFDLLRLGAYWNRIEPRGGDFDTAELDWQLELAERSGKQVIVGIGAIKNFGYPEFFVPEHQLERPLREGSVVRARSHQKLLLAAQRFIEWIVRRYRDRRSIVAWQLEHEAVDPLGVEHSWRLGVDFVESELGVLKSVDSSRPVLMNGFLPTSSAVRLTQWWSTRGQGDSLALAARLADLVGIDYYPRHALARVGPRTLYLDAAQRPWQRRLSRRNLESLRRSGKRLMVSEGQAEPWETETRPPSRDQRVMLSCRPEHVIENYNAAMELFQDGSPPFAYLFWGAEYWLLRRNSGDMSYLRSFERVVQEA